MPPRTDTVERFDVSALGSSERTPQGFLRVPAYLTRAGVFKYRRADGSEIREYRPAAEVFAAESMRTLATAPVTDLHPREMVSPKNVRQLAVGHVGETSRQDGRYLAGVITIQDADAIAAVERGDRREISMGYRCRIDATPGTHDGEAYDVVQRGIIYNHAAIGPANWGRAGREVRLRIDGADGDPNDTDDAFRLDDEAALAVDTIEAPHDERDDGGLMDVISIKVDGIDVSVPKQSAQLLERALSTRDTQLSQLTAARDGLQGKLDAQSSEVEKLKARADAAEDPKRVDSLVAERAALYDRARRVLGAEHKFDGQTTRQIHEAALTKLDSKLELKSRSDEYVAARFDHAVDTLPVDDGGGKRNDGLSSIQRKTVDPHGRNESQHARNDAAPRGAAWQTPLAMSKDASR